MKIPGAGKVELVYTAEDGSETRALVHEFRGPGIVQGQHNLDGSIASFARACFAYALDTHQDLWFSTKDTISKVYDHNFKDIFAEIYEAEYREALRKRASNTSTPSSTTRWRASSAPRAGSSGRARTTMATS